MRGFVIGVLAASLVSVACATNRAPPPLPVSRIRAATRFVPRVITMEPSECADSQGATRHGILSAIDSDEWLGRGQPTLTGLDFMRRTVVQVNDHYFDSRRIDPPRMLAAMFRTLADRSDGFLRIESDHLVTAAGARWAIPVPKTIWQIPLAVRDLGYFLLGKLPPDHRLAKGPFAEVVMTNAMLGTLDSYSVLLSPKVWAALREPMSGSPAPATSVPAGTESSLPVDSSFNGRAVLVVRPGWLGNTSAEKIRNALGKASAAGVPGVVMDLRGNRGGLMEVVPAIADLFLSNGTILTMNAKSSTEATSASDDGLASERVKLIVLVDGATSSGAEILAGALRFRDRALLLGESTSGDGLIQVAYDFKLRDSTDMLGLKLSIAEALLPGDRAFHRRGIAPDVEVTSKPPAQEPVTPTCASVGETIATVRIRPGQPDPVLALAARILRTARTASRTDLLAAAKDAAAASPE